MTEESARKVANAVLGAAAAAAVYTIVRNPPLRRAVWRLAVLTLTGTMPKWLGGEIRQAWAESGDSAQANRTLS